MIAGFDIGYGWVKARKDKRERDPKARFRDLFRIRVVKNFLRVTRIGSWCPIFESFL